MSRIRKGNYKQDYTVIPNETIQSKELSWKAKGLLIYLLSLPGDWVIHKKEVHKNATDGYDSTNSAFLELEEKGYLISEGGVREAGMFSGKDYYVYPIPKKHTDRENPERSEALPMGKIPNGTDGENPDLQSKQVITPYSRNKTKETIVRKKNYFQEPSLKDVEDFVASKGYNSDYAKKIYEHYSLGNWKDSTGKPVVNWKQKINTNWLNKDGIDRYKIVEENLFNANTGNGPKMVY